MSVPFSLDVPSCANVDEVDPASCSLENAGQDFSDGKLEGRDVEGDIPKLSAFFEDSPPRGVGGAELHRRNEHGKGSSEDRQINVFLMTTEVGAEESKVLELTWTDCDAETAILGNDRNALLSWSRGDEWWIWSSS